MLRPNRCTFIVILMSFYPLLFIRAPVLIYLLIIEACNTVLFCYNSLFNISLDGGNLLLIYLYVVKKLCNRYKGTNKKNSPNNSIG